MLGNPQIDGLAVRADVREAQPTYAKYMRSSASPAARHHGSSTVSWQNIVLAHGAFSWYHGSMKPFPVSAFMKVKRRKAIHQQIARLPVSKMLPECGHFCRLSGGLFASILSWMLPKSISHTDGGQAAGQYSLTLTC